MWSVALSVFVSLFSSPSFSSLPLVTTVSCIFPPFSVCVWSHVFVMIKTPGMFSFAFVAAAVLKQVLDGI